MKCDNCGRAILPSGWKRSWVEIDGYVYCARADCSTASMIHQDRADELIDRGVEI